jgi:hypothetical protein
VPRRSFYRYRSPDLEFAKAWDEAYEVGTDLLEDVALERAVAESDLLLIFQLKARRPWKYRDNAKVQHVGAGGGPVELAVKTARDT